jgi:ParB family chromosome partitioning protein
MVTSTFKKRALPPEQALVAEEATADVPMGGDPRIAKTIPVVVTAATAALGGGYQVGVVYALPLANIKSNPMNPRAIYTSAAVDEMATSLTAHGQRISATGFADKTGTVTLIEGETRLRAARAAGIPTLRVEIRPEPSSMAHLYEEARAANVERKDQTPLDDAIRWKDLLASGVYSSNVALAQALGLSESTVSRTLSLASMPAKIIQAVSEFPELMTYSMLTAIREYCDAVKDTDAALELLFEINKNGLSYRDVANKRKALEREPLRRVRSSSEPLMFKGTKGELKFFEDGGRVELSLKGLSAEDAQELKSKLLALFPR